MDLPDDLDFSNPALLTMLPFPSLLAIPSKRFECREQDNVDHFQYMGRSKFTDLYELTHQPIFCFGFQPIYLYGSAGSGKSHVLAALVCRLIRDGKRVVYIPDCNDLLKDFVKVIRLALRCAFYDSQLLLKTIESARDVDRLLDFCERQSDIYFVIDQLNALEFDGRYEDAKKRVRGYLHGITFRQKYIFSAFANQVSNREANAKYTRPTVIRMDGVMNQVR
jgi:hypothetical protein